MRVLILAEVELGRLGGCESAIHGLISGLASLERLEADITVLTTESMAAELRPVAGSRVTVLVRPAPGGAWNAFKRALGPHRTLLGRVGRALLRRPPMGLPQQVPLLDPWVLGLGADVIHFMLPDYAAGSPVPTVYTMHDLQQEHLPELFSPAMIAYRRMLNDAVAAHCTAVVAISRFTAGDFLHHHPCTPAKVSVIPWAAYLNDGDASPLSQAELALVNALPRDFLLYPAFSFQHKNHIRLLESLSALERREGMRLPLVCTGGRSAHWELVRKHWQGCDPRPELIDLGHVSRALLLQLHQRARGLVFPTLFEGAGLPLLDAARLGLPVACSSIAALREFGAEAPLYFDPQCTDSMASAIASLWADETRRQRCVQGLSAGTAALNWSACAKAYLDLYQRLGREAVK